MTKWLRTPDQEGNQHVLYLPEVDRHCLSDRCQCTPKVDRYGRTSVVIHQILDRAYQPPRPIREH